MITEISGINAKSLCVAAKSAEKKHGESIEEILISLIYQKDDVRGALEAMRLFYSIIFNSRLTLDDFEMETPAEIISLNGSAIDDEQGS